MNGYTPFFFALFRSFLASSERVFTVSKWVGLLRFHQRTNVAVLFQARKLSALNTGVVPEGFKERQQNQTLPVIGVYVNFGRPYTPADERQLLDMYHQSYSLEEMADKMGRSPNGLFQHIRKMAQDKKINLAQLFNDIRPFLSMKRV